MCIVYTVETGSFVSKSGSVRIFVSGVRAYEKAFRVNNNNKNDGMKDSFQLVAFLFINI